MNAEQKAELLVLRLQRDSLRDALVKVLDASNAEREARVLLLTLRDAPLSRPPTPVGWSDTDWLRHLETCPPIGYAVRDNLYGTSKAGVLRFCSSDEAEAFAVYASPRPTQTEPSPSTPPQVQVPLTEFKRMQIIGDEFPLELVAPVVIAKVDSVRINIERAHGIGEKT